MKRTLYNLSIFPFYIGLVCITLSSCTSNIPPDIQAAYRQLPDKIDFNFDVRPILSDRCFQCHGPDEKGREADLRLDIEENAFAALTEVEGFAFVAGKPAESEAVLRILHDDPDEVMPPPDAKIPLSPEEKAIIYKWVQQGAEWKAHWSFIPPEKAKLPKVRNKRWLRNEIDGFILKELERRGLKPSVEAAKETLIRRLSLDLIGLPPSPEEIDAFLSDDSPNAYEKVVDRLMASPKFGEKWAWDWLDAARYADTNGFQGDPTRKMWPWRDWVVRAINENMPYDQFTVEQLAGDLLPNATTEQILATAFNRNHTYNGEGGRIPEETRVENVMDRVETMGTVWMGLTLNCCRCHDHKFDQLSQKEYYQLYDYFNQTSELGMNGNGMIPPLLNLSPEEERTELKEAEAYLKKIALEVDETENDLFPRESGKSAAESPEATFLDGDQLYALSDPAMLRSSYHTNLLRNAFVKRNPAYAELLQELRDSKNAKSRAGFQNLQVMVMDQVNTPRQSYILQTGIYDKQLEPVDMGVPAVLPALLEDRTHNRLELAQWLVTPEHPLMARVTVNRFWQSIFGSGLVKTTEDFGVQGEKPSHPELLDWMAVDFVENGWDVKRLLKQMVMSATYRQVSKLSEDLLEVDPDNRLLARGARYRIPSWMIRDQALYISGLLNDSIGGPAVKPYQPPGIWEEATFGKTKYVQDHGSALYRRSLYAFWRRIVGPTFLFDNSARQVCSVRGSTTNSPMHALATFNDVAYAEAARVMAARIMQAESNDADRIRFAFRLATSRMPEGKELELLQHRLEKLKATYLEFPKEAQKLLGAGEYLQAESLDPVEQAAFAALCLAILNLDETITKQ